MSRSFSSIQAFLRHLAVVRAGLHAAQKKGEKAAGAELAHEAQEMIGHEHAEWPPLADSTVADKQAHGFTGRISATDPLYRTGELRVSISYQVDHTGVVLGSSDPIAHFHEFGTSKMPARSFIGATMFKHGHEAADTIAASVVSWIASMPIHAHGTRHYALAAE